MSSAPNLLPRLMQSIQFHSHLGERFFCWGRRGLWTKARLVQRLVVLVLTTLSSHHPTSHLFVSLLVTRSTCTSLLPSRNKLLTASYRMWFGCHMQVHLSRNNVPMVKPPLNHTSLPFSQHVSWQCCNHPGILSSTAEILLFNSVFHNRVTPIIVSTLKPWASPKLSVCI